MNRIIVILYITALISQIDVQLDAVPADYPLGNGQPPIPYDYEQLPLAQSLEENLKAECNLKCPINELCMWVDNQPLCHCPQSISFFRINNQCREMYANSLRCDEHHPCDSRFNEECVKTGAFDTEGTCQCLMGYRRDFATYQCKNGTGENVFKERRRPVVSEQPEDLSRLNNKEQEIVNDILKKVLEEKVSIENVSERKPHVLIGDEVSSSTRRISTTEIAIKTTTAKTTTTTTTASTTTTTPMHTDAPAIMTKNLVANAGEDIHIYYPSKTCILNGSRSQISSKLENEGITWIWTKQESSPAFGKFVGTNRAPIAYYENLVEGVYRFVLSMESSTGEFSRDTVDVVVHSSYIAQRPDSDKSSNQMDLDSLGSRQDLQVVYDNLVQIELSYTPEEFTQFIENDFISRLEILLKKSDHKFNNPKVILTNTRITSHAKNSHVILELFVCEDLSAIFIENHRKELNVFDFKKHADLEEDMNHWFLTDTKESKQNIISSDIIVHLLKRKSLGKLIDSTLEYIDRLPIKQARIFKKNPGYSELHIIDVSVLTCEIGNFSEAAGKCSEHGECDHFTGKCVCDKYWMPNLYLYYLQNDQDLTSGNNCEWNVLLVTLGTIFFCIGAALILKFLLKYIFYYLFCCCLCCRRNSKRYSRQLRKRLSKDKYRQYGDNEDDDGHSDSEHLLNSSNSSIRKKKPLKKLFGGFSSAPKNSHKYALLEDQENLELVKKGGINKCQNLIGNRFEQRMGDELDSASDDAIFDIKTSPNQVKEYKNLI